MPVPRVSILLPVRNGRATLARALDSIGGQTLPDWELVAIDDGSTDGTAEFLQAAARRDPRLRVVLRPAAGLVSSLNAGLAMARAPWIARMDADDEMLPTRLERQAEWLERHPAAGLVSCRVEFGGDRAAAAGYARHVSWINAQLTPEEMALRRFVEAPVAHPSVMFRREWVARHGGYREGDFPEDYELWLRWMEAGVVFHKVPEVLLRWHDPPGRLSRTDPRYGVMAFQAVKAAYLARWLARHVSSDRELWVWGAGRVTRRRLDPLLAEGLRPAGYVDIDPSKQGVHRDGRRVVDPGELPDRAQAFVLGCVGSVGAREQIDAFLRNAGWIEGSDYLFAA